MTYREIEASLDIATKQIHMIVHDDLHVRKLSSRWIPHNLKVAEKRRKSSGARKC